jgi:hypothetical protein
VTQTRIPPDNSRTVVYPVGDSVLETKWVMSGPLRLRGGTQVGSLVVAAETGGTREVRRESSTVPEVVAGKHQE